MANQRKSREISVRFAWCLLNRAELAYPGAAIPGGNLLTRSGIMVPGGGSSNGLVIHTKHFRATQSVMQIIEILDLCTLWTIPVRLAPAHPNTPLLLPE